MSVFWYTQDVGIEADGGWHLGVSRIVATRGIYASYVNYTNNTRPGASSNILRRLTVQDSEGFSYFPAGVTLGPAYILPQALLLGLLGSNNIAYKIFPFAITTTLILVLVYLTCSMSGRLGGIIIGVWLWARPDLYVNQTFDAFGESYALLFLIISLIFAIKGSKTNKYKIYALSGIFFGLAFLTKLLILVAGGAFMYAFIHDVYVNGRSRIKKWLVWCMSLLLPILAYESYLYLYVVTRFGYSGYIAIIGDFYLHLVSNGSGVSETGHGLEFFLLKSSIWTHLNMSPFLSWAIFATSLYYGKFIKDDSHREIYRMGWFSAFGCFIWYLLMSPFGWFRHVWFGVMLYLPLAVAMIVRSLHYVLRKNKKVSLYGIIGMMLVLSSILGNRAHFEFPLRKQDLNELWDHWRKGESPNHLQGPVFAPIFSWREQKETADFITSHIPPDKKLYYNKTLTIAEMSTLSDKVFFPIYRYLSEGGTGYLILGPYQKGFASYLTKEQHDAIVANYCDKVVFSNPSYTICHLYEISGE